MIQRRLEYLNVFGSPHRNVEDLPAARVSLCELTNLSPASKDNSVLGGVLLVEGGLRENANLADLMISSIKVSPDILAVGRHAGSGHALLVRCMVPIVGKYGLVRAPRLSLSVVSESDRRDAESLRTMRSGRKGLGLIEAGLDGSGSKDSSGESHL